MRRRCQRAEIAARAAAAIEAEAVARAVEVAASAETALETVAAERRDESDVGGASSVASSVAATVADDVVVQARATSDAAATVAAAVTTAAQDAARAAALGCGDGGFSGWERGDHRSHRCRLDRRHAGQHRMSLLVINQAHGRGSLPPTVGHGCADRRRQAPGPPCL